MRKISVGSFPLIDINPANRKFIESYLINTLADLISINQISSSIYDDRAKFITPTVIMDYFKTNKNDLNLATQTEMGRGSSMDYRIQKARTIKNAFGNTKNLYRSISNDPFFKNFIFYPIYIEESIKGQNGYSDYKYDFLILSNDLIKQQMLDEVHFDDKITMLFLVLKDILFPYVKLTDLGKNASVDFKKYFSIYLETCKNENINPFDLFVKIIKFSGAARQKGRGGSSYSLFKSISSTAPSAAFANLFNNTGEIKDVNFLLSLTQRDISNFLNDRSGVNQKPDKDFNSISRQYAQAKTHEYSKIVSIIDSMIQFNKQNNVSDEINDNQIVAKLSAAENHDIPINIDGLLNDLEVIYFKAFLDGLIRIDNSIITQVVNNLRNVEDANKNKIDLFGVDNDDIFKNIELINNQKSIKERENQSLIQRLQKLINDKNDPMNVSKPTDNEINQLRLNIDNTQNEIVSMASIIGSMQAQATMKQPMSNEEKTKKRTDIIKADIGMDYELYKSHLTAIYGELYTYFYSKDFETDVNNNISNITTITNLSGGIINQIKISIDELNSIFQDYYINKFESYFENNVYTLPGGKNRFNDSVKSNITNSIKRTFENEFKIEKILINYVFTPIFKKYSNPIIMEAQRIKNLRTEKNPLLRKLLSDTGIFKAFIINQETILGVYDILHYLDTLKYEVGLINNPVSQVSNDINKMNFIINRLGLSDNPVFVINQSDITLSMPNHLSLTGQNFINKIPKAEFLKVANISFNKDLWSKEGMFGKGSDNLVAQKRSIDLSIAKDEIAKAKKSLEAAKNIKDKKQKEDALRNAKIEMEAAKAKERAANELSQAAQENSRNATTLSGNINPNMRDQYERTWRNDGPNRAYDRDLAPDGRTFNENDRVNDIRDGMDRLSNQNFRPQNNGNNYNPQNNFQNRFSNNPHIQNRYQDIQNRQQVNRVTPYYNQNNQNNPNGYNIGVNDEY